MKKLLPSLLLASFGWYAQAGSLLFKVPSEPLQEHVILSGLVKPLRSESLPVKWYAVVTRIGVSVGQTVKQGDLVAEIETQFMKASQDYMKAREVLLGQNLKRTKVDLDYVKSQQTRVRQLAAQDIVAKTQLGVQDIKVLDAEIRLKQAQRELEINRRALLDIEQKIREANYYAPIDGIVTQVLVNPKQLMGAFIVNQGQTLAVIEKPGKYLVKAQALDTQLAPLHIGQSAKVIFESSGEEFQGKISALNPLPKDADGLELFEVQVVFDYAKLVPQDFLVRVEIPVGTPKALPSIPWTAVVYSPDGHTNVNLISEEGEEKLVPVELGKRGRHRVQVTKGLESGQAVESKLW